MVRKTHKSKRRVKSNRKSRHRKYRGGDGCRRDSFNVEGCITEKCRDFDENHEPIEYKIISCGDGKDWGRFKDKVVGPYYFYNHISGEATWRNPDGVVIKYIDIDHINNNNARDELTRIVNDYKNELTPRSRR